MPNGDYTEPTMEQEESRHICQHIEYVYGCTSTALPNWVHDAARDEFGDVGRLKQAKNMLVKCLKNLFEDDLEALVYDAHKWDSRKLADWWEKYLEQEKREDAEREQEQKDALLRESALKKLTPDEIDALSIETIKRRLKEVRDGNDKKTNYDR